MSGEESSADTDDTEEIVEVRRYDWTSVAPSIAVAEVISDVKNSDANELAPLYEHIDPEAIDQIIDPEIASRFDTLNRVSFTYDDCRVTVRSNGEVTARWDGSPGDE
ncbi:hypothetical protein ZOD2009_18195 [Haladaptatus paucihalophilus DX253]|uniref:Halobacterial output domain-containing protein n=1 Tax=Haladaptatus paucihalophilus DX253 TaxID=797209 RepID=E7QXV0_HALPU|nr:HalOD1 output domain-containing protein [Haladaptatus paucihalophilus]EFW90651.1 hypothetical protein ZOD2009_18195 [Haladaptatus paucihalophilus DX253]SHL56334.1 hypothetical protein SAMN05444342_4120 [Haladaptatus paucihalophilus DX253]